MIIKEFSTISQALKTLIPEDEHWIVVRHNLVSGEEIRPHAHATANEWILVANGSFRLTIGDEARDFSLSSRLVAIHIPVKQEHSLLARSPLAYFVLRDRGDDMK